MRAGINPALDIGLDGIKITRTVELFRSRQNPFHDSCRSGDRFEGGTGRQEFLRGPAVERTGQVCREIVVITRIHLIDKPVVVVTRVGHAGFYGTVVRVRYNDRARAGVQSQLGRRDFQIVDLIADKIVGAQGSVAEVLIIHGAHLQDALVKQQQTDLASGERLLHQHITENTLAEVGIFPEIFRDIIRQAGINLRGIHIHGILGDSVDIDPVSGNGVGQKFLKAYGFLFRPGPVGQVGFIDGLLIQDTGSRKHRVDDIGLIDLHLIGEIFVGSGIVPEQLVFDLGEDGGGLLPESAVDPPLIL